MLLTILVGLKKKFDKIIDPFTAPVIRVLYGSNILL